MTRTLLAIAGIACLIGGVSLWMLTEHMLLAILLMLAALVLFATRKLLKTECTSGSLLHADEQ